MMIRSPISATLAFAALVAPHSSLSAQDPETGADSAIGRLYQIVDAVPLRGQEIRLRAALRVADVFDPNCVPAEAEPSEVTRAADACESVAYGWIRIDGQPAKGPGPEVRTTRITADGWSMEEVRTRVPGDALEILFGVAIEGAGPMWADDIQLAVLRENGLWRRLAIPNAECDLVGDRGRPSAWGGLDPGWVVRVDRDAPYEGSGAIRLARSPARTD